MMTTLNAHNWRTFLTWSAMSRAWRLLKFGCLGGFLFLASETLGFKAVLMGAGLGLAVFLVFTWKASRARARARADKRWRAMLDHYAQKELDRYTKQGHVKRTHSGGRLT